jgi:type VI secretion system secreted protein Hcp
MASNMYIKFEDPAIETEGTEPGHEHEIPILSWSHGFVQPTSPTGSAAGTGTVEQAAHQDLSFTKYMDTATNTFLKYTWSGKQIGKATISCYRSAGTDGKPPVLYLQVMMQHVIIANYRVTGGSGEIPVENISLSYGIVEYRYLGNAASHNRETGAIG